MLSLSVTQWAMLSLSAIGLVLYALNIQKAAKIQDLQMDLEELRGKLSRQATDAILKDLEKQAEEARRAYEGIVKSDSSGISDDDGNSGNA